MANQEVMTDKIHTSTDTLSAVDEHHGYDGNVVFGFDYGVIFLLSFEQRVVRGIKHNPRKWHWLRVDVTSAGSVFSTGITSTILAFRGQQINVIGTNKGLGQIDDRGCQTLFTVVVCSMLTDIPNKLGDLKLN